MSYSTSNPPYKIFHGGLTGAAWTCWAYVSADAVADVDGSGYITNAKELGMKVNDGVFVVDTATPLISFCRVHAIDATTGAGNLSNGTTIGSTTSSD
jgi:hypothetical protein